VRRRIRAAGWGLIAAGVIAWTVIVVIGAFRAHSDTAFNRWVGWATIAAVPIAAAGVLPVLWAKITGEAGSEAGLRATEDELWRVVLSQAQVARSRLIGPGEPGDEAANISFARSLGFRGVGGASDGELASVLEYYQSLSPRRLVVLGEPGAGKTVLALELQVRLLEARGGEPDAPVPVLVGAAAYDTEQPWEAWLAGHLALRFGIRERTAARLVRDGRILPLVDGLDEMDPAGADDPRRARSLVSALNAAMRGRERAPVVMTCRRREYSALGRGIDSATHVEMTGLAGDEAASYLRGQFRTPAEQDRWKPVLASLDEEPYGPLAAQMATPWRLTLALAAFRDGGDPAALLPPVGTTGDGYAQYLDSLLLGSYVPSAVRLHPAGTPYSEPQVRQWLTALADGLAWQSRHGRSATDIVPHQWWRPAGQQITRGAHAVIATLPAIAWLIAAAATRHAEFAAAGCGLLLIGFLAAIESYPRRMNIRKITKRQGLSGVAFGVAVGAAGGVAFGVVFGAAYGLTVGVAVWVAGGAALGVALGVVFGVAGGVAFGAAFGVALGLADAAPDDRGPLGVIRASGISGLVYGLAGGLAGGAAGGVAGGVAYGPAFGTSGGVAFGITYGPAHGPEYGVAGWVAFGVAVGVAFGVAVGVAYGLAVGGGSWVRYHVAVAVMAARGQGPLRLGAFLDWAADAGLLRVSGVSYQFRHRQLQDWLTSQATGAGTSPAQAD
jgi:NACHT domain